MLDPMKNPAARAGADRADLTVVQNHPVENIPAAGSPQQPETLSITIRRNLHGDLPVWVRIRNVDGLSIKLRPGPTTSPDEFNRLVEAAKDMMRGVP